MTADERANEAAPGILPLFRGLIFAAVCAGLVAGAGLTLLHFLVTSPLIAQAETYEVAAPATAHPQAADHQNHTQDPAVGDDFWHRAALTGLADLSAGIGYALLLCAGLVLRGGGISLWGGLLWGLAGFVSFSLAPALGLPPELPGTAVPAIVPRQIWWLVTAAATAGGFALLAFKRPIVWAACGIALAVAPHVIGAPRLAQHASLVPEELIRLFVAGAMASNLVFWVLLGFGCVMALRRFGPMAASSSH